MRRKSCLAAAVALTALLPLTLTAGCGREPGSPQPLGILSSGKETLLFIGKQCDDQHYPNRVRLSHMSGDSAVEPVLWEVVTTVPNLLPSVVIGKVPQDFTELTNNFATQGNGGEVKVEVDMPERFTAIFDLDDLEPGQVLDATGEIVSLDAFRKAWGCAAA
jgi:hypothetical protein